jgi:L-2-hydroxyglutarate oxidase LhgO
LRPTSTISADPSLHNGEEENPYTSSSTVPCWFLSPEQARELEPDLSRHIQGALLVTSTGIVDSQGLVDSLAREVEEEDYAGPSSVGSSDVSDVETTRGYGAIIRGTRVVRIDRDEKGKGWVVQLEGDWEGKAEGEKGEISSVQADVVINAAGLSAVSLTEGLIPASEQVKLYTVKGELWLLTTKKTSG